MTQKKILVPIGPEIKDLKSVHYALALAERLQAKVFILQWAGGPGGSEAYPAWLEEALADLIASARLAGLSLSHLTVNGRQAEGAVNVVKDEGIHLVVLSKHQSRLGCGLLELAPHLEHAIIRVEEKDTVNLSEKKGEPRWQS